MKKFKQAMLLYSKRKEFKQLTKETKDFIKKLFKTYNKPYVAFSGGKDSTVLLHLTLQVKEDVDVVHTDWGPSFIPREIKKEIIGNAIKIGAKKEKIKIIKIKEGWRPWQREILGIPGSFWVELEKLLSSEGFDLVLLGFRGEESRKRYKRTRRILDTSKNLHEAYPLRDWTYEDIYAYIFSRNLPLLHHYEDYSRVLGFRVCRFKPYRKVYIC